MRSLSVTTISRMSFCGALRSIRDPVHVVRRDPHAARPAEDVAVALAGQAHRRRIDDRQQFGEVLDQHAGRTASRCGPAGPIRPMNFSKSVALGADVLQRQGHLLLDRQDLGREQSG